MPELPEVETIKNALLPLIKGKRISSIDILKPKLIKSDIDVFKTKLIGKTFHDVTRHGKYLFFHLDENLVIIVHLRMEGKFQYMHRGDDILSHARIIFHFADGEALVYRDSRMFGLFYLSDEDHYQSLDFVRKVAKEPFDMNENELFQNINKHQHLAIKTVLLDQSVLAGLGNIYVDETLFRAHINPMTKAKYITLEDTIRILKEARIVLNAAIKKGGSTIKTYHSIDNVDGHFQNDLLVYGKAKKPCPTCHKPLKFTKVNGRGTTYCSSCQYKRGPKTIAITGLYGSGKSSVRKIFRKRGYLTYDCDAIVKDLYELKSVKDKVLCLFQMNEIDFNYMRLAIRNDANLDKKLKKILYPELKKYVKSIILKQANRHLVFEVALLFDAKMEDMFDFVIGVKTSNSVREKRLIKRDANKYYEQNYDRDNHFFEHEKECDIIIINDGDISNLEKKLEPIFDKLNI